MPAEKLNALLSQSAISAIGDELFICNFELNCIEMDKKSRMVDMTWPDKYLKLPHRKVSNQKGIVLQCW